MYADAVAETGGWVLICPLCLDGTNNKIHLILSCKSLASTRNSIQVGEQSLSSLINCIFNKSEVIDEIDAVRNLLSDTKMTETEYLERGLALDILIDVFFKKWSSI